MGTRHAREARPPIQACLHDLEEKGSPMKLALVTIVTTNLEQMRRFYQAVLQIEPQIYRGDYTNLPSRPAPSPYGASPSVQSMGSVLCEVQPMIVS